jgi:hypothetical protein
MLAHRNRRNYRQLAREPRHRGQAFVRRKQPIHVRRNRVFIPALNSGEKPSLARTGGARKVTFKIIDVRFAGDR